MKEYIKLKFLIIFYKIRNNYYRTYNHYLRKKLEEK